MAQFAKDTVVSPEKTLIEIQTTLKRYKAAKFAFGEDGKSLSIAFEMSGRRVRFAVPLPTYEDGRRQVNQFAKGEFDQKTFDQAVRQRYRALLLCIKAKLESVESGIETFDEAFMAQILLPSGETIGEWAVPHINIAYETGAMPPLLGSGL